MECSNILIHPSKGVAGRSNPLIQLVLFDLSLSLSSSYLCESPYSSKFPFTSNLYCLYFLCILIPDLEFCLVLLTVSNRLPHVVAS